MRKKSGGEGSSMSDNQTSPTNLKKAPKSRRKLPFSENITTPSGGALWQEEDSSSSRDCNLTPRRHTPLSERQQIALLCKISSTPTSQGSSSVEEEEVRRNERGETPLHLATIKGDYRRVHTLLRKGAHANTRDFAGWTPLHEACNYGWYKIAKLLIEFGADVNAIGLDKFTPLHDAAVNAHEDIVKLLLKSGADPLQKNAHCRTPLDLAKTERISDLLKASVDNRHQGNLTEEVLAGDSSREAAEQSPCQPSSDSCDLTMRKNSPQNQTHKGVEKPTSPRLTLRFQSIRSRDESKSSSSDISSSSSQHKYQSYCVTMETNHVTSTSDTAPPPAQHNNNEKQQEECVEEEEEVSSVDKMEEEEAAPPSRLNGGGRLSVDSSNGGNDPPEDTTRRKRRRSNDSSQSNRSKGGHKSPSGKSSSSQSGSPKVGRRQSEEEGGESDSGEPPHSPKVPPLKIVIPPTLDQETRERSKVSSSKQALPYVVNTTCADTVVDNSSPSNNNDSSSDPLTTSKQQQPPSDKKEDSSTQQQVEEKCQRVTRSSQRMQAAMSSSSSKEGEGAKENLVSSSSSKGAGEEGESSNDEHMQVDVHPRKRKLREGGNPSSSSNEDSSQQQQPPVTLNSYQMFQNIRKQVDRRRRGMVCRVQPKVPHGFKDYLLNRGAYVLSGNPASRLSVPMITPPQSLEGPIKELFIQQEKERYRLRLQHLIQREKLVLSVEQEILRVHGQSARAMANQNVPLSACSVLKDGEIYNVLEVEQDDKDKNTRSRYNGRLLLSWLQDVDDKWKKIKENMLLRHHNEAESLHAVQRLDWEWKMKELGMCDRRTTPSIDDIFVPIVHVDDEFKTLSACH